MVEYEKEEEPVQQIYEDNEPEVNMNDIFDNDRNNQKGMNDLYDVYGKAVAVHSRFSDMSEDYTLTRYDVDAYNMKVPKFIREQRKLLRIVKSFLVLPESKLSIYYPDEQKRKVVLGILEHEYAVVEELLIGEIDEMVIMGRTPAGEVIGAFLKHGMSQEARDDFEHDKQMATPIGRAKEERR